MATLYELTENIQRIYQEIENGSFTAEMISIKEIGESDIKSKILDYGRLIIELESETEAIKAELKRLSKRKAIREKAIEDMKTGLENCMGKLELKTVKDTTVTVLRRKKPDQLEIVNEDLIPDRFKKSTLEFEEGALDTMSWLDIQGQFGDKVTLEETVAKKELNAWYRDTGEVIPGTNVLTDLHSINIK